MTDDEPKKKNPIGETGKTVASNVKRLRESQRLAFTQLAAKLEEIGKPIPTLGLRHIEANKRRVDSDDLVALAVALHVSPVSLLMPASDSPDAVVSATATGELAASALLLWLQGEGPLPEQQRSADMHLSLPEWRIAADQEAMKRSINEDVSLQNQVAEMQLELKALAEKLRARGDD